MAGEIYVFGDESGQLDFNPRTSRYFILTTIVVRDCRIFDQLLTLRRELAWEGLPCHPEFHATDELQPIRERVFQALQQLDFRVDATIFEKRKARPDLYTTADKFYRHAWFYHFKFLARGVVRDRKSRLLVVPATLGDRKKKQELFSEAVRDVVRQTAHVREWRCAFWRARTDPCLWAVDYCSWAIQRKWEHTWNGAPDDRSYRLIEEKIGSEFDIFRRGTATYY
jgi:hypothetical protein